MADVVLHKIENMTKVEAMLGTLIFGLIGILYVQISNGQPIDMNAVIVLVIMIVLLVVFQLLYFLKFIIEKDQWRKDQECMTKNKTQELTSEIRKLEVQRDIKRLELAEKGINMT